MKRFREPWIERTLKAWAAWVIEYSRWVGWGGGADDPLADAGWSRGRTPGCYSNPVLAEAALHSHWAGVHGVVMSLPASERRVLVARYCGYPVAVPRDTVGPGKDVREDTLGCEIDVPLPPPAKPKDVVKAKYRRQALQRMARPSKTNVCWLAWRWSGGPLPFARIATLLDLSPSTCHDTVERAKLRLMFRLAAREAILNGQFSPDGVMDPAKLARAREATQRGRTWAEQQKELDDAA